MNKPESLGADYFDDIFDHDDDPWSLASSDYEAAKFSRTCEVLADRRYDRALEVGCAHGVLTTRLLSLCANLLAVDISAAALTRAKARFGTSSNLRLEQAAFPLQTPADRTFDLVVVSEVAYYWSDDDLDRAAAWMKTGIRPGGRLILVHYTGETDYPQSGEGAVAKLWVQMSDTFDRDVTERGEGYRLDLWSRR